MSTSVRGATTGSSITHRQPLAAVKGRRAQRLPVAALQGTGGEQPVPGGRQQQAPHAEMPTKSAAVKAARMPSRSNQPAICRQAGRQVA